MATAVTAAGIIFSDGTSQTTAGLTSVVKSIQRGEVAVASSGNITINAVNLSKSILLTSDLSGGRVSQAGGYYAFGVSVGAKLTSSTNIYFAMSTFSITWSNGHLYWQVIEFY